MNKDHLIFLDTETTGIGKDDRVCQVAYTYQGEEYDFLFKPPVPITIDAMVVTNITNAMVKDHPPFIGSLMFRDLESLFALENIVVAHNAPFDIEMLRREGLVVKRSIDTFKIAHHLDTDNAIPKKSLQYLRYYYDLEVENAPAHSALGDVKVLEKLFDYFFSKMMHTFSDEEKVIEEMIAISSRPILYDTFNFGKYAGKKVSEVSLIDQGYIGWMLNQKIMMRESGGENDENWIYTLDHYLARS